MSNNQLPYNLFISDSRDMVKQQNEYILHNSNIVCIFALECVNIPPD